MLRDLARRKAIVFVLSGSREPRSMVMRHQALGPPRAGRAAEVPPLRPAANVRGTSSSFSLYGRAESVASCARFSLDAPRTASPRVIADVAHGAGSGAADIPLASHGRGPGSDRRPRGHRVGQGRGHGPDRSVGPRGDRGDGWNITCSHRRPSAPRNGRGRAPPSIEPHGVPSGSRSSLRHQLEHVMCHGSIHEPTSPSRRPRFHR